MAASTVRAVPVTLVGEIDVQGLLALNESVPVGYESVRINIDIAADASDKEIGELLAFAEDHSPVRSTICRPVPVTVERVRGDTLRLAG